MKMGRKLWTGALVAVAMTVGSVAGAATIDDFSIGFTDVFLGQREVNDVIERRNETPTTNVFEVSQSGIGFFGADRTATLNFHGNLGANDETFLRIFGGQLRFEAGANDPQVGADFVLRYDNFGANATAGEINLLDYGTAFEFSVVSTNDFTLPPSIPATITVWNGVSESASVNVNQVGDYLISFNSFAGIDFTSVTQIDFAFSNTDGSDIFTNFDISFGQLAVVPVPPAAGLILLGMVGFGLRRQFAKK